MTYSCLTIISSDPASCQSMQDEIKRLNEKLDNLNAGKAQKFICYIIDIINSTKA